MTSSPATRGLRFGPFHADPLTRELRKGGTRVRIPEQSVRILLALVERAGDVVTRDELAALLWPSETEVDVEHGLNSAVRRLRDALGDSAERPVFVETVPRVGYRFIGTLDTPADPVPNDAPAQETVRDTADIETAKPAPPVAGVPATGSWRWLVAAAVILLGAVAAFVVSWRERPAASAGAPSRPEPIPLTFDGGLQTDPAVSPDGQWVAYASDSSGRFDVWTRRLSGGDPVRVTDDPADDSQPDWSPDMSRLVFRSERAGGGLIVAPVTGGAAQRISATGFRPRWSPDGRQILFAERVVTGLDLSLKVIDVAGGAIHAWPGTGAGAFGWEPDSTRVLSLSSLYGPFEPALVSWTSGSASTDTWAVADSVTREFRAQQLVVVGGEEVMVAPAKSSLYFVGASRGRRALWQIDIDARARRVTAGPRRITTLPDANNASLSPDGKRVVFDGSPRNARLFAYPLGPDGRAAAEPEAITSEAVHAASPTVSRDGSALAFVQTLPGSPERSELTARLRGQSRYRTIRVIDHPREVVGMARWNDDGTTLAYSVVSNANEPSAQQQIRLFDAVTGADKPLTSPHSPVDMMEFPTGWAAGGRDLIVTSWNYVTGQKTIARLSVAGAPAAERSRRLITTSADAGLSLGTMSPDARWVAFRVGELNGRSPRIAVVPAAGGDMTAWTFITAGDEPADKPGWSDDGTTLYFTSGSETLNVMGIRFDPVRGRAAGEPFKITDFSGPGAHVYSDVRTLELGVGGHRLVVPIVRPKGSLWMLELTPH